MCEINHVEWFVFRIEKNEWMKKKFIFCVDLMQQKSTNDSPRNVCSFSIDEVSLSYNGGKEIYFLEF